MKPLRKLMTVETKLFVREPPALFWALAFPAILLAVLGGLRLIDVYVPIVLAMAVTTVGVMGLPTVLVAYRQYGILRRMAVTPIGSARLLSTQLLVHLGALVVAALLAVGVGVIAFDVPFPRNPVVFVFVLLLAATALFAIGLLIGSVAPTISSGQGIAMAVYFPLLLLAGIYFPRETMPDAMRTVSDLSPAGAAVQALQDAWAGTMPRASSLAVMAVFAVAAGLLSWRLLRWD